jgi:hypothetical protein
MPEDKLNQQPTAGAEFVPGTTDSSAPASGSVTSGDQEPALAWVWASELVKYPVTASGLVSVMLVLVP